jgi:hypothetical protein
MIKTMGRCMAARFNAASARCPIHVTSAALWCYGWIMLTRWEVEGQLRNLHPMRQNAQRTRRELTKARRRARITVAVLLGLGLLGAWGAVRGRSDFIAPVSTIQGALWGGDHVGSYQTREREPLFPPAKRQRWDSFAARASAARDPITGELRYRAHANRGE